MAPTSLNQIAVELSLQTELAGLAVSGWVGELLANPWQEWCRRWLESLADDLPPAPGYEVTLLLTGDRQIQELNRQFRHQDKPTDVLAFAALEGDFPLIESEEMGEPLYLGDIVISLERAGHQAEERGHSAGLEVIWLTAHGLLHLLGWDHPDEAALTAMLSQQSHLLTLIDQNPPLFT
ncbi:MULTISPECIES: rRNA maturation RNase YbeY [unclassified Synechocystis]|uniref:rRNA maturation RNase YbeY n=1 Tax=unclassified Synechocystis TaxID=2640012 RepID=UPI00040A8100|nr:MULTISPECIES: rRNA maturation RNase YbeY [unclassified Synechocystis]AIE73293.1 Metal-dependent hydrolase YbeY, involved in rRNA and/or ribosome maturation and assembly [Synechocystis sp. PCC 6714]MCT0253116.1 rRNA maturation RNase YbeY [Synechocystis sp. CS-94]